MPQKMTAFETRLAELMLEYHHNRYVWAGDLCIKLKKKISFVETKLKNMEKKGLTIEHHSVPAYYRFTKEGRQLAKECVDRLEN